MYIYLTSTYRGGRIELAQKRKWFLSQSAFYKIVLSNFLHYCVNFSSLRSTSVLQIKKTLLNMTVYFSLTSYVCVLHAL